MDSLLWSYIAFVTILNITPGQDMALLAQTMISEGRKAAFANLLGFATGVWIHIAGAVIGISHLFIHVPLAFHAVKFLGAAYLIWIGVGGFWKLHKKRIENKKEVSQNQQVILNTIPANTWAHFRKGFFSNLLNPKIAVFYLTVLPQFIRPEDNPMTRGFLLAGIQVVTANIWLSIYIMCLHFIRPYLMRDNVKTKLELLAGTAMVALGVRIALS